MINAEYAEIEGHANHLKYAAQTCSHKKLHVDTLFKNATEVALHVRAIQSGARVLFVALLAEHRAAPVKGSKDIAWWWHVVVSVQGGKPTKKDLMGAVSALIGDMGKKTLFWKPKKHRVHGFVRIGKKLDGVRIPRGL